jgi:hypothetical protein
MTLKLIKYSWSLWHVSYLKMTNVSGAMSVPIMRSVIFDPLPLHMLRKIVAEMVSETSIIINQFTWLITQLNIIKLSQEFMTGKLISFHKRAVLAVITIGTQIGVILWL